MGATLDALHRLQGIESKLYTLRQTLDAKRREIRIQKRRVKKAQETHEEQHAKHKAIQVDVDRLELERKGREDEIAKLREQMKVTKTNKEYAALRVQINTLDANNRKLEDRILEIMANADEVKTEADKLCADLKAQEERLARLEGELAELEAETQPKIDALMEEREAAAMDVPPTAMQTFDLVAEHHESQALAKVIRPNAKRDEFICGGCQMSIPLENVNALMNNSNEIQTCHVCGRILYLEPEGDQKEKSKAKDKAKTS